MTSFAHGPARRQLRAAVSVLWLLSLQVREAVAGVEDAA
jgi:hypothetical protein